MENCQKRIHLVGAGAVTACTGATKDFSLDYIKKFVQEFGRTTKKLYTPNICHFSFNPNKKRIGLSFDYTLYLQEKVIG